MHKIFWGSNFEEKKDSNVYGCNNYNKYIYDRSVCTGCVNIKN